MTYDYKWTPKKEPWLPADYDDDVIYAIRALSGGTANAGQQKIVWDYLMFLTAADPEFADLFYRPGEVGRRDTDFALGKNYVGQQLRKLLRPELTPQSKPSESHHHQPLTRRQIAQRMRRVREKAPKE